MGHRRDSPHWVTRRLIKSGLIVVAGEISPNDVDIESLARETVRRIGYDHAAYGFDCDKCEVITAVDEQSPHIAQGVDLALETRNDPAGGDELDRAGAGDQA